MITDDGLAAPLVQLTFDFNEIHFIVREQKTDDRNVDISSMYYTWTMRETSNLRGGVSCIVYNYFGDDEHVKMCSWYDEISGVAYSLGAIAKNLDDFDIKAAVESMMSSVVLSIENQKCLLEENRNLWYQDYCEYTFTDLDHNGLMELISAHTDGFFTYVNFYEVLPDGSGIRHLSLTDSEGMEFGDWQVIIQESLLCYYDTVADKYYYVCKDYFRNGVTYNMTQIIAFSLKDGAIERENLASMEWYAEWTSPETEAEVTYQDEKGNLISEEDFNSVPQRRFAGLEYSELELDWITSTY